MIDKFPTPAELVAAALPVSNADIRAWLDEHNIPVFIGVQTMFAAFRVAATRAAEQAQWNTLRGAGQYVCDTIDRDLARGETYSSGWVQGVKQTGEDLGRWACRGETPWTEPRCDRTQPTALSPAPHDYEEVDQEFGSLGDGGSYDVLRCRSCGRVAYSPMGD